MSELLAGHQPTSVPPDTRERHARSPRPRTWLAGVVYRTIGAVGARIGLAWVAVVAFFAIFAPFLANSHPFLMKSDGEWSSPMLRYLTPADVTLLVLFVTVVAMACLRRFPLAGRALAAAYVVALTLCFAIWPSVVRPFLSQQLPAAFSGEGAHWREVLVALVMAALLLALALATVGLAAWLLWARRVPTPLKVGAGVWALLVAALLVLFPVRPPLLAVYDEYRRMEAEGELQFVLRAPIPYSPRDRLRDQSSFDRPHPWPPPGAAAFRHDHWLGTERFGADILSRLIHASRIAMAVGFISTGIALIIGIVVGALMGYFVGWVDLLGMRVVEIFSAIPTLYLLLAFVAFFGRNLYIIMVIIGLVGWVGDARFVRAEFLKLRKQDFVQAAVAAGLPLRSILFKHLLPNALAPLLVSVSFGIASAILAEATLSFLGLGLIDEPSWGALLNQAVSGGGGFYWWLALFPGLAIFFTVLGYNLIGEAVRDAIDPHLQRASQL